MSFFNKLELINRLHHLIKNKSTGTPKQLANRISYSERRLYRLLNEMRNYGFPIKYCIHRQSYMYEADFTFVFDFKAPNEIINKNGVLSHSRNHNKPLYQPSNSTYQNQKSQPLNLSSTQQSHTNSESIIW